MYEGFSELLHRNSEKDEWADPDSNRLDSNLNIALKIAYREIKKNKFNFSFIDTLADEKKIQTIISFGDLFSTKKKHLLVKRHLEEGAGSEMYSDIYTMERNKFVKIVSDTSLIYYSFDTIEDLNGDNISDYMVGSYSSAGCCPRDSEVGYLYNEEEEKFIKVEFFNPSFDTKNKIVYESEYGYPGDVSIDKYRWNGFQKILIESIYPDSGRGSHGTNKSKPFMYQKVTYPGKKREILKNVPEEYKSLEIYKYFIRYQQ